MIETMTFALAIGDRIPESREAGGALSAMGEDEFRLFYERTARPLWAYLSRLAGDAHKADDLLQETYYRFCRAAARYESEEHRRNSLFRIATNLARDAARYEKHRPEVSLQPRAGAFDAAAALPTPEQQVAVRSDVQRALGLLDPSQRELLLLAYGQGASHKEIAAILGLRAISVRTLLRRARTKMAALLGGAR
jgi:RNA polymerase sigma-70 factor (ECF subfamily)